MQFSVSVRNKPEKSSIIYFLNKNYPSLLLHNIDSVFGFVEKSTLYGGRLFTVPEISDDDISEMYQHNINLRLPMTNHLVTRKEFDDNIELLEKYHIEGNVIIATNDDLAKWIRSEFPLYHIEASVIKNINTISQVNKTFELYDSLVIPMYLNRNYGFLASLPDKNRIRLFSNGGCAVNCPSKICYPSISKLNKYNGGEFMCSTNIIPRKDIGMTNFDIYKHINLGFSLFKLIYSKDQSGIAWINKHDVKKIKGIKISS